MCALIFFLFFAHMCAFGFSTQGWSLYAKGSGFESQRVRLFFAFFFAQIICALLASIHKVWLDMPLVVGSNLSVRVCFFHIFCSYDMTQIICALFTSIPKVCLDMPKVVGSSLSVCAYFWPINHKAGQNNFLR